MALLRAEALSLSNNNLISGVIDELIERDDLFAILPFVGVNGKAYVYNREVPTAAGIGQTNVGWVNPADLVGESSATFAEIVTTLKILVGDVDVDKFLQSTMSDTNSQLAIQVAKKVKAVGRAFHQTLAAGDVTVDTKSFDGLSRLVTSAQTLTASTAVNGSALTMLMMDELVDSVPLGADVIIMRRGTIRAYRQLLRAYNGTDAAMQQLPNFGRPMLTHNGIPIIMNEFLPATETKGTGTNLCSVYAARMNQLDGLHGIYGGPDAGLVVENLGTVQNKDATRMRVKWYTSLVLKSTKSLARIPGVTNI